MIKLLFVVLAGFLQLGLACNLSQLGNEFDVDKVNPQHAYENIYCDLFEPIKDKSLSMLEIGFGKYCIAIRISQ